MKRSIISVSLLLLTFNTYAQTGAGNLPSMNPDPTTNPSETRFGNTSGVNIPQTLPSTIPSNSAIPPTVGPQQQQERTNFAGGSLGGQTINSPTPTNSTTPPSSPSFPQVGIPSATGVPAVPGSGVGASSGGSTGGF